MLDIQLILSRSPQSRNPTLAIQVALRDESCLKEFALTGFFSFFTAQTETTENGLN